MITFNVFPSLENTNPQNYLEEKKIIIHKKIQCLIHPKQIQFKHNIEIIQKY